MAAVTLTTLRARARVRADQETPGFVPDTALGIDAFINEGGQKLWELLIKAYGQQFVEKTSTFNTVAGSTDITLPADFLILYGVELNIAGVVFSLVKYNHTERNLYRNMLALAPAWRQRPRYNLSGMGSTGLLKLFPAPDGAYAGSFLYAPVFTPLVNASDTVDFPNGWERYIVVYTAIQLGMKEESSVTELRTELKAMTEELEEIANRRDANQPHSVVDAEAVENDSPLNYF